MSHDEPAMNFNPRIYEMPAFQRGLSELPAQSYLWVTLRDGTVLEGLKKESNQPSVIVLSVLGTNHVTCISIDYIMAYQVDMKHAPEGCNPLPWITGHCIRGTKGCGIFHPDES